MDTRGDETAVSVEDPRRVVGRLQRFQSTLRVAGGVLRLPQRVAPVALEPVSRPGELAERVGAPDAVLGVADALEGITRREWAGKGRTGLRRRLGRWCRRNGDPLHQR